MRVERPALESEDPFFAVASLGSQPSMDSPLTRKTCLMRRSSSWMGRWFGHQRSQICCGPSEARAVALEVSADLINPIIHSPWAFSFQLSEAMERGG